MIRVYNKGWKTWIINVRYKGESPMSDDAKESLKHHFITHLLQHHTGIQTEELVEKSAKSAGVDVHEHRATMLTWIENLVKAGHLERSDDGIKANEESLIAFQHMVDQRQWEMKSTDPRLWEFFHY